MPANFPKNERLKSRKAIESLFTQGHSFAVYPIRIVWSLAEPNTEQKAPVQVTFTVSKRNFKRANKRNLLRRRMREAWRLNKDAFFNKLEEAQFPPIQAIIIYSSREELTFNKVENAIQRIFKRWKLENQ